MPRTTRSSKRFRRAKRELIWSTVVFNQVPFGADGLAQGLVVGTDWVRSNNFEKGAVLLGIRGWYQVTPVITGTPDAGFSSWFMAISKDEEDSVVFVGDWTTAAPYNSEDVLYVDGGAQTRGGAESSVNFFEGAPNLARFLEVKSKRKLNSDDVINVRFQTDNNNRSWYATGVFRALVQLP